jgi:mono/diheme cytochrome c family protein
MKRYLPILGLIPAALLNTGCARQVLSASSAHLAAYGSALVESGGGKQIGVIGSILPQPVVIEVKDEQGNAVTGAPVAFSGPAGTTFDPATGVTDASGQFTTNVSLGGMAGRYQITVITLNKVQKRVELKLEEIALGYQQVLGRQLNDQYCDRCHNPESTPERVSNYDNLEVKPHPFTEGETLNKMSDADLTAIISHGGPALNRSPLMPPYGYTLSKTEIQALISYIRAISDPPYQTPGLVYAKN